MKTHLILLFITMLNLSASAQTFTPSDAESTVTFAIKHFGLEARGTFKGLTGNIAFDPGNLTQASVNVTVDANTIDTGVKLRDKSLRSEDYLDVAQFSTLRFTSVKIERGKSPDSFIITGDVAIKDKRKTVSFPFTAMRSGTGYRFTGKFVVNRRDFGVGGGSVAMGDDVVVEVSVLCLMSGK